MLISLSIAILYLLARKITAEGEGDARIIVTTQVPKPLFRGLHYAGTIRDLEHTATNREFNR
ncbi:MAG: hypothetical protein U9N36_09835, partial [Euryarchaeota archaeon]|nr:hypothetical protein [Euryarchaeota archaeon]